MKQLAIVLVSSLMLAAAAVAQMEPPSPHPNSEARRIRRFVDPRRTMKPGPMGPAEP